MVKVSEIDAKIAQINADKNAAIERANREARARASRVRREAEEERKKRAYVIGEFVLARGEESVEYQAIVGSEAFERFLQSPKLRGRRRLFGFEESAGPNGPPAAH